MKASLKFREENTPLLRAKIPVGILGLPFVSGISSGDPGDLSFSLQTGWIPGLSLKLTYRPNDSNDPFLFAVKSGIGSLSSSEKSSAMTMAAEFSLLRRRNPCFFLCIKPAVGDFSARKAISSQSHGNPSGVVRVVGVSENENRKENGDFLAFANGLGEFPVEKLLPFKDSPSSSAGMREMFSGTTITARTKLPVRKNAVLKIRWGVNFPVDVPAKNGDFRNDFCKAKLPFLTVDKISIENVAAPASNGGCLMKASQKEGRQHESNRMLYVMNNELEALQRENAMVRESIRELSARIGKDNGGNLPRVENSNFTDKVHKKRGGAGADNGWRDRKSPEISVSSANSNPTVADVSEELKKALRGVQLADASSNVRVTQGPYA